MNRTKLSWQRFQNGVPRLKKVSEEEVNVFISAAENLNKAIVTDQAMVNENLLEQSCFFWY